MKGLKVIKLSEVIDNYVWRSGGDLRQHRKILKDTVKEFVDDLKELFDPGQLIEKWEGVLNS